MSGYEAKQDQLIVSFKLVILYGIRATGTSRSDHDREETAITIDSYGYLLLWSQGGRWAGQLKTIAGGG